MAILSLHYIQSHGRTVGTQIERKEDRKKTKNNRVFAVRSVYLNLGLQCTHNASV